jgi:hypothetical protein
MGHVASRFAADVLKREAQAVEYARRIALGILNQPQEQMSRTDFVMSQTASFCFGEEERLP